ncbi:transcriptional regulator, LysR family [Variovorax sp. OK605]|jgi:DNA-binding transcriptional LysR family regulator|uniref:LysR family transcriptional regulator n=1 Tax=unclassified Variovorax TaxID=663243 RepID=UPI0008D6F3CC|nr:MULTISPECIES: LysR family transcriptional regulator [unclassified Variovorax]SEK12215.1 DNA-binding transcriptional regulator, LysR family [Variovorax sp. OK202]SFD79871.1 transcriptional regulator, LysR family [Variovorax sp. OK212]SFP57711.1 transcriptional regulator, LysR family [Variovorax sp. OK605]
MDVQALGLLVDIIEAGNLSKAAAKLGMSRANVSQRINRFERELGAQLLRRTTRQLEPTELGRKLYEHGLAVRHEVKAASEAVSSLGKGLRGMIRLSVPSGYGQLRMSGWLAEFMQLHPEITLHVIFDNDIEELIKGSVDFAVRVMADPPAHLAARALGQVRYVACATPAFIAQNGRPENLDDLKQLPLITSPQTGERVITAGTHEGGHRYLRIRPRLISTNFHFLRDAIAQGLGVGLVPDYMVAASLAQGELQAFPLKKGELDFLATQKFLLYVPSRFQTLAVRTLVDFLVEKERQ